MHLIFEQNCFNLPHPIFVLFSDQTRLYHVNNNFITALLSKLHIVANIEETMTISNANATTNINGNGAKSMWLFTLFTDCVEPAGGRREKLVQRNEEAT